MDKSSYDLTKLLMVLVLALLDYGKVLDCIVV